jgi:hypothetical protein
MTITNPGNAGETVRRDASAAARRMLGTISLGSVAPESFAGQLNSEGNLVGLVRAGFDKGQAQATIIVAAARADIEGLRRDELRADPFANDCLDQASRSIHQLPAPLDTDGIKQAINGLIGKHLPEACRDVDRMTTSWLRARQGADRKRKRLKAELDQFINRLTPVLADHIAGLVRDDLAAELTRRYEATELARAALRRHWEEATDPGNEIPGAHRFSLGPRLQVVLKAAAVQRSDLLHRDGRPTEAIWPAFGAHVAAGNLGVMEDPQEAIKALGQFLESAVASALDGLTLDALYAKAEEPPESPSWIGLAAARMLVGSPVQPDKVHLAQVPDTKSDVLINQIRTHIPTATSAKEENRLQLMELTYSFTADEVLGIDRRGLAYVLDSILPHVSNPKLKGALQAKLAAIRSAGTNASGTAAANGHSPQGTSATVKWRDGK